jgi:protein-S-isoprenylcysteine O-methyltransferase Ste14
MFGIWHAKITDLTSMVVFLGGSALFFMIVIGWRLWTHAPRPNGARSRASIIGIVIQAAAMAMVAGPVRVVGAVFPPLTPSRTVPVAAAIGFALWLFTRAVLAMGQTWAIVAQVGRDHQLVTSGPFATIRNPIYVALAAYMLAMALTFRHAQALTIAFPVFMIGTMIRVRAEELLLRARFGPAYDDYAARVHRFIPGIV